jgi:hypothetical protein
VFLGFPKTLALLTLKDDEMDTVKNILFADAFILPAFFIFWTAEYPELLLDVFLFWEGFLVGIVVWLLFIAMILSITVQFL